MKMFFALQTVPRRAPRDRTIVRYCRASRRARRARSRVRLSGSDTAFEFARPAKGGYGPGPLGTASQRASRKRMEIRAEREGRSRRLRPVPPLPTPGADSAGRRRYTIGLLFGSAA